MTNSHFASAFALHHFDPLFLPFALVQAVVTLKALTFLVKQLSHLFQCHTLCLNEDEPDTKYLNDEYDNIDKVELPSNTLETDWINILIEDLVQISA